jgi:hypothetical protein
MSLLGMCMIVLGIYVAIKVVSLVIRLSMVILVIFGLYLLLGPLVGG